LHAKVSWHLKGSVPEFTQLWKGKSFPCFENRRDSRDESRLSHGRKGLHQFVDRAEERGNLQRETYAEVAEAWRR